MRNVKMFQVSREISERLWQRLELIEAVEVERLQVHKLSDRCIELFQDIVI